AATASVIGAAVGLLLIATGCDVSSPDRKVQDEIAQGRVAAAKGYPDGASEAEQHFKAAADNTNAYELTNAQAKQMLGQAQSDSAQEMLREADRKEVEAARI